MANSLRAKLTKLRHDRRITEEEYQELIKKLDGHDAKIKADAIDSCKTVVMETIDNELLVDTLLMRMDKLNESMPVEEINAKKYIVCCPMCDNETCAKGTTECDAEKWKAAQLKKQSNTYTAIVDGVKRDFM